MEFSIVTISAFVAILNETTKTIAKSLGYNINRLIPICSLIFGVILGVVGYYTPNVQLGNNLIEAIFIGLSAGAASTGCHQVYKQLSKDDDGYVGQHESTESADKVEDETSSDAEWSDDDTDVEDCEQD